MSVLPARGVAQDGTARDVYDVVHATVSESSIWPCQKILRQQPIAAPIPAEREPQVTRSQAAQAPLSPAPDLRGEVESKAADSPALTLPESGRSTATLPGPTEARRGPGDEDPPPAVAGSCLRMESSG